MTPAFFDYLLRDVASGATPSEVALIRRALGGLPNAMCSGESDSVNEQASLHDKGCSIGRKSTSDNPGLEWFAFMSSEDRAVGVLLLERHVRGLIEAES